MKLFPPDGMETRPITDRAKEGLFSVLYKYNLIENGVVADLFCGTGSMGMECLSRDCRWVTFIDSSHRVIPILERNIEKAGFKDRCRIVRCNAFKVAAPVPTGCPDRDRYDLVFIDPPYEMSSDASTVSPLGKLLVLLSEQVRREGIVVVRTHERSNPQERYGRLRALDHRRWGTTAVTLYQCGPEDVQQ
jgi:16S rRNA (guanine966-N2)-methyltransferase